MTEDFENGILHARSIVIAVMQKTFVRFTDLQRAGSDKSLTDFYDMKYSMLGEVAQSFDDYIKGAKDAENSQS